jgi:hypothetical protein
VNLGWKEDEKKILEITNRKKVMNRILILLVVVANIIFSGCSGHQQKAPSTISDIVITTTYDPQAEFPRTATYSFLRLKPEQIGLPPEAFYIVERLRNAIQDELKSKKYKLSERGKIDYIIDYRIVAEHNIEILDERSRFSGLTWISVVGTPDNFVKGALVIDAIEVKSLKPVWRGVCNANIASAPVSEEEKQARSRYAVKELLKTFPPK